MFKNHLKIALRNLNKRKGFALINIIGLALGVWCSFMITLWVIDEFKQDAFHEKGSRIYQLLQNNTGQNGDLQTMENTAYPIGDALVDQFPEIEEITRLAGPHQWELDISGELVQAEIAATDPSFFNIFSFPLKEGNSESCLLDLSSIIISQELADNYFPEGNVMGKTLDLIVDENKVTFKITGVFDKIQEHSSLQFNAVIPIDNYLPFNTHYDNWGNSWLTTYVLLEEGATMGGVNQKISDLPKKMADTDWFKLFIQPFQDRYLYSKFENGAVIGGRIDYVKLFLIIAAFTLLIACFNFINLTTAWSARRSKEVGIKKVMGANKRSLTAQFFMESVILVIISVGLSVVLAKISMPMFNEIAQKNIAIDFFDPFLYLTLIALVLITALFSGIYPAFFLSSLNPIRALKGKIKGNVGQVVLRKGLVITQFFLCMVMVVGTIVVYLQLRFIQNKNLGLDKENVIYVPMDTETYKHAKSFRAELAKYPSIKNVSTSNAEFIDNMGRTGDPIWEGKNPESSPGFAIIDVDYDFLEMMGISLTKGRYFSPDFSMDSLNYIINEAAAKVMELENPLGKSLSFWGEDGGKIIGVAKDFHFASLHNTIDPMIIRCRPSETELFYVKAGANKTKEVIASLEQVHEQFSSLPFSYHFLNDTLEKVYDAEQKVEKLGGIFAVLAIFISCLGLFGLAAFTVNQRTKEIAMRKVLGASVSGLFNMMSKDIVKLILIALLIALPISWYLMNNWIQGFAFHIDISWWMFALSGLIVLLIALFTVSYHTIKAARTNPIKSLRTE
jgi:ABC-type antimicrobial peptide transport system permease subunit